MAIRTFTLLLAPALALALAPALAPAAEAQTTGHEQHAAPKVATAPTTTPAPPADKAKGCPRCEKMKAEKAVAPPSYLEDVPMDAPPPPARRNPHQPLR